MTSSVHRFEDPVPDDAPRVLGGKGASLARMTSMGLPVPPGFTIPIGFGGDLDAALRSEIAHLEGITQLRFGEGLLVAVRSGAPSSMPGMLETVLDVGGTSARALTGRLGENGALDVRRRFLESYGTVVLGVPRAGFDAILNRRDPRTLDPPDLHALIADYERLVKHETGEAIPDDPFAQLRASVDAVLRSYRAPRAQKYREAHSIADEGTAVTVQAMVYGNAGERSGTGVAFSRSPSTGERAIFGEWIANAQGEDIVSGRRTPGPLTSAQVRRGQTDESLEGTMPELFAELRAMCDALERAYRDAVDVEITIERGVLYALQCRPAKRTARAAARIAVEMVDEGSLSKEEALARIEPQSLRQLLTPRVPDPQDVGAAPIARGLAASPGAATGKIVLDLAAASKLRGELILVRSETSAEDVEAMRAVDGILTSAGGLTSHAAVVARAMGKPCVAGATSLSVDYVRRVVIARAPAGSIELPEGTAITIDGARGLVYGVEVPVEPAPASPHVETVLAWADAIRTTKVLARAGSARLARVGMSFGADGIAAIEPLEDPIDRIREAAGGHATIFEPGAAEALIERGERALRGEHADDMVIVGPLDVPAARLACARRS